MSAREGWLSGGRWRTGLFLAGAVVVFFGERMFATRTGVRIGMDVVGALFVLGALALRLRDRLSGPGFLRPAVDRLLACQGVAMLALILYALQTEAVRGAWGPAVPGGGERDLYGVALGVLWPLLLVAGATPLALLDHATGPMRRAGALELRRTREALRAGLSVGLAVSFLFVGNFLATRHDASADLAYFRAARPGSATVQAVKRLEEPLDVVLFFPKANDVLEHVRDYFAVLEKESDKLKVRAADRLLHPALAKEYKVRQDGTIVLARGDKQERWRIGTKLVSARRDLSRMDGEFNKRMSRVASAQRYAYLVTGHGELNHPASSARGGLATARDKAVRKVLAWLGYRDKMLGLSEGLGSKVPEDAAVVLLLGPRTGLLPAEEETLVRWVGSGGRLLLALEPDGDAQPAKLLATLGLTFDRRPLTHDRQFVRGRHNLSDRQLLFTKSFSSHPSVRTLAKESRHLAVIVDRAGSLGRAEGDDTKAKGRKVDFSVRSLQDTWADLDGDRTFDEGEEKRRIHNLAAAVVLPKAEGEEEAGRAFVLADSDVLADPLMGISQANLVLLADAVRWLQGEEEAGGLIETEEDVPVEHTSEDDALWFHGTVFAIPLIVLLGGLAYVRRTRRRRDR